ncbi:hypothetical protein V2I01_40900 [Micromonospora sp. BRA006-A]|nr:hypothetical protein [Micromonospora sp. BRA006-A]
MLERLLGEHVAGEVAAVMPATPPVFSFAAAARSSRTCRAPAGGGGEQILAVDEQLAPPVARYGELRAAVAGEFQRAGRERVPAEPVDHRAVGVGVEEFVRGQRAHPGQRDRADHVGQVAGGGAGGDQGRELVLVDGDQVDLDAGLGGVAGDDRLGGGDAIRHVFQAPDGDLRAVGFLPVVAACGHAGPGQCQDQADGEPPRGG